MPPAIPRLWLYPRRLLAGLYTPWAGWLSRTVQSCRSPHQRVRLATAAMLLLVGCMGFFQVRHMDRIEQQRGVDTHVVDMALHDTALSQQLGRAALLARLDGDNWREQATHRLQAALAHSQAQAQELDLAILSQKAVDAQSDALLHQALKSWHAARERLWYRAGVMLNAMDSADPARTSQALIELQTVVDSAVHAGDELALHSTKVADARHHLALNSLKVWAGVTLLLLALALGIGEPTARAVGRQHQQTTALLAALPNGVVMRNAQGQVVWSNSAVEQQLRLTPAQVLGREQPDPGWSMLHEDGQPMPLSQSPALQVLASGQALRSGTLGVKSADGELTWLHYNAEPMFDESRRATGSVVCYTDITEHRRQQLMLAHTVEAAGVGTWLWDMGQHTVTCNDRLLTMLGYRPGEISLREDDWLGLIHPEDRALWQQALRAHQLNPELPCRAEMRIRRPDSEWAVVLSCGVVIDRDVHGQPSRMAGIHIDQTEQVQMQAMLRHAARTDGLTQMPNRAAVFDHVQQVIDRARSEPDFGYAVLFMDFDRFKQVNDTLGHAAGDELLRQIASRLRQALRGHDSVHLSPGHVHTAGRIGGDEFVVVLEAVNSREEACAVARRLMNTLAAPYQISNQLVHSSASIGIVTSEHPGTDANTVMRDADTAMYEAKRCGRGRYVVFDTSMHERVAHSVDTERDLRLALQRDELFVIYQPVVDLQHGGPAGVEALVRWRHPTRGLVSPLDFITVAEESGLIVALGHHVLRTACTQFVSWQALLGAQAPKSLAVNLSPRQLHSSTLIADVQDCIAQSGIKPQHLQLEVTESLAAQDDSARAKLRELKALGVRIALDDFGTGYSSLACLHQLPVDTVKIDRSFVTHAETSAYHRVLIEATIRVAQTLGMSTVAEGIETDSQAALMRELQCAKGQGYLFARPLEEDALLAWCSQRLVARPPSPEPLAKAEREVQAA